MTAAPVHDLGPRPELDRPPCPTLAELNADSYKRWYLAEWNGSRQFLADAPIPESILLDRDWGHAIAYDKGVLNATAALVANVKRAPRDFVELGPLEETDRRDVGGPRPQSVNDTYVRYCEAAVGDGGTWWLSEYGDGILVYLVCGEPRAMVALHRAPAAPEMVQP